MIVAGTHETPAGRSIAEWFGRFVGKPTFAPYSAIGCLKQGELCNAALFVDYNGSNIELHMAGTITRALLRDGLRYAFLGLNVQRVTAKPYRSNVTLREIVLRLGFEPEGVMHRYYGPSSDDDAIVYRLDRPAAEKWMK